MKSTTFRQTLPTTSARYKAKLLNSRTFLQHAWSSIAFILFALLVTSPISSVQALPSGLSLKFAKPNWNDYKIGSPPDVKKDFDAPFAGCTGFLLAGKPCASGVGNHATVEKNPVGADSVMAILYKSGVYASRSGGQFYKDVSSLNDRAMLEYDVYFPSNFDWRLGGKLPGLYGGGHSCSGSKVKPNGQNCFSSRLMWREGGDGEVYQYLPFALNNDAFCRRCQYPPASTCSQISWAEYCAWERGSFRFQKGRWNKIQQYVKLNTPGKQDGVFELYLNGLKVVAYNGVVYRSSASLKISGMLFSTFFGGDSRVYAPKSDQKLFFRAIKIYA